MTFYDIESYRNYDNRHDCHRLLLICIMSCSSCAVNISEYSWIQLTGCRWQSCVSRFECFWNCRHDIMFLFCQNKPTLSLALHPSFRVPSSLFQLFQLYVLCTSTKASEWQVYYYRH